MSACLRSWHTAARKEMHRHPHEWQEKTSSGVVNLPPSGPIVLDICCRVPGPRPSFQALLPLGIVSLPPYDYEMTLDRL